MNNGLQLVKSAAFMNIECDFYKNQQDVYCMTSEQLGMALGYSDPQKAISNIVNRNAYLQDVEFSSFLKLRDEVQARETRIFTEDGIYEVSMLAKTPRAREFRGFVRNVLKKLRDGSLIDNRVVLELVQSQKELLDKFNLIADRLIVATNLPKLDYAKLIPSTPDHREIRLCSYKVEKMGCGDLARHMRAQGHTYAEIIHSIKLKTGHSITKSMLSRYFLAVKALN